MNFSDRPLIITDLETTGLDYRKSGIIEIGAIQVDKQLNVIDTFEKKIKIEPMWVVEPKALEINGYNEEDWKDAISLYKAVKEFGTFAQDGVLVAWNTVFENPFLKAAFQNTGHTNTMDYHCLDVPSMVWFLYPWLEKINQDAVSEYFGIPKETAPHRAMNGAKQTLEILKRLRNALAFNVH